MTRLDRRSLLLTATLVATQASIPEWLAHAFGLATAQGPLGQEQQAKLSAWRREQLRTASLSARALGRPLLVMLVPDGQPSHAVGQWYGALFGHGSMEAMVDLTLCTLVCASADEVKAELGTSDANVTPPKQGVAMLLIDLAVDPKAAPTKVTRIEPELELTFRREGKPMPPMAVESVRAEHTWREAGLQRLASALHEGMERHGVDRAQRAATVAKALSQEEKSVLQAWLRDGGPIAPMLLWRVAPLLQQHLAELPETRRAARREELGKQLRMAVEWQSVSGASWGDASCPPCGRGHVPPLCERFLDFYTVGG